VIKLSGQLSWLFDSVGGCVGEKQLLNHMVEFWREWDPKVFMAWKK